MRKEDRRFVAKIVVSVIVLLAAIAAVGMFYIKF